MRANSKKCRKAKRNEGRDRRQRRETYRYTCCIAAYHDPSDPEETIVRYTAAVVDLKTDRLVECLQIDSEDVDFSDPEACGDRAMALAEKYGAKVCLVSGSVPLEPCGCGCGGYSVRCVTGADLSRLREAEFEELMASKLVALEQLAKLMTEKLVAPPPRTGWDSFFER